MNPFILLILFLLAAVPILGSLYHLAFTNAIDEAMQEYRGRKFFNRWWLTVIVFLALIAYALTARLFEISVFDQSALQSLLLCFLGILYLAVEIPYQLVKMAAKDKVEQMLATREFLFQKASKQNAELLAERVRQKLKVDCELQTLSHNQDFVFLTYVVNSKPIATRLKLSQVEKSETWTSVGEWIIRHYQEEHPQVLSV
jgi:hypothetical protein